MSTDLAYKKYASKVHQLIHVFVKGKTAEMWINPKERKKDGQLDDLSLLDHYGGEGNKVVRIKYSEALRTSLIYKNERAVSFRKFLTNVQMVFTVFSENGEILNYSQKIRLLFQKFQNPIMTQIKASPQVSYDMDQANTVTYDFIANGLAAEASILG